MLNTQPSLLWKSTLIGLTLWTAAPSVQAQSASASNSGAAASATTSSVAPAEPSTTLAPTALLEPYPALEAQSWCTSPIFCAGEILTTVELAQLYPDSKTFPDKPTRYNVSTTVQAFQALKSANGSIAVGDLENWLDQYFTPEGEELVAATIDASFNASATPFLQNVTDPVLKGWIAEVISYWSGLIRETNSSALCGVATDCASTLIPLNHTVVVPGGRYREVYYWDSYWIIEGLLNSGLASYAKNILLNFMDELSLYGFIPNGGRTYYLNRSQPPLFIQMLSLYVDFTNDTSILAQALPLADAELQWWYKNRTGSVTSPFTNTTYEVARYDVFINTAPRPEGFVEDWETVNLANPAFNASAALELYSELASGAESGWDYTVRFMKDGLKNISDPLEGLRSLNIRQIVPVELNALLAANYYLLADLNDQYGTLNSTAGNVSARADLYREQGDKLKAAVLDLNWDPEKLAFYDFNTTSSNRSTFFSVATFYPYWLNIIPPELEEDESKLFGAFAGLSYILHKYNGSVPASLVYSTLNWDFPNAWPPHQYIILKALRNLPSNVTTTSYSTFAPANETAWSTIPSGQLGLEEADLPAQGGYGGGNRTVYNSDVITNGGNISSSEPWSQVLLTAVVQRYIDAAFCSWYSTGGSLPGILSQLPADQLNVTNSSPSNTGNMFEKFNATDIDAAGGGGEYTVVTGFGWTNGVVIWAGANYGSSLVSPTCPAIAVSSSNDTVNLFAGNRIL
ncbi:Neutral trehalase [Phaffia rhodozyma]|uniref:Trehalase n=1 Tax=Phaffia rhodozyma TaxID=264483 RepID=A0A0F7SHB2_PHARH|nr:Neutral trehalase [Phaffia rhodozyma]